MSVAHLHLLLNHAPIFGAFFAAALLLASLFWAPDVLRRTAFVVLVGSALAALGADLTGDSAADLVRGLPGVRREMIHDHEETAEAALIVSGILGVLALAALVYWRKVAVPRVATYLALVGALVMSGVMSYAGLQGGLIRHTEVRPGATSADAAVIEPPRGATARPD